MYCKCGNKIPEKRSELGFTFCVDCSIEQKWSGNLVVYHKTGNTYEIIKDPEVAADVERLSSRNGFGSKRKGMTKIGNKSTKKIQPSNNPINPTVIKKIPVNPSKWKDEEWTLAILDKISSNKTEASLLLEKIFKEGLISPIARKRLLWIINSESPLT